MNFSPLLVIAFVFQFYQHKSCRKVETHINLEEEEEEQEEVEEEEEEIISMKK